MRPPWPNGLGHDFADLSLLQQALAHRSWCGEQEGGAPSNERLEFLGDAVLGLVVAGYSYSTSPTSPRASWPRCARPS